MQSKNANADTILVSLLDTEHEIHANGRSVNDYIKYRIDDIPFRTSRRYQHTICSHGCCATVNEKTHTELLKHMTESKKMLSKEDETRMLFNASPMDSIFCQSCGKNNKHNENRSYCGACGVVFYMGYGEQHIPHTTSKQWFSGRINYTYLDIEAGYLRTSVPFMIYCDPSSIIPTAILQFQKPDNFKNINSVKVWGPDHTLDRFSAPCYPPPA